MFLCALRHPAAAAPATTAAGASAPPLVLTAAVKACVWNGRDSVTAHAQMGRLPLCDATPLAENALLRVCELAPPADHTGYVTRLAAVLVATSPPQLMAAMQRVTTCTTLAELRPLLEIDGAVSMSAAAEAMQRKLPDEAQRVAAMEALKLLEWTGALTMSMSAAIVSKQKDTTMQAVLLRAVFDAEGKLWTVEHKAAVTRNLVAAFGGWKEREWASAGSAEVKRSMKGWVTTAATFADAGETGHAPGSA